MSEEPVFDYELAHSGGFESYKGTALDVRAVIEAMPRVVKDGFCVHEVPFGRFRAAHGGPGDDVPVLLARLRSTDADMSGTALNALWDELIHQGTVGSVAPLAVPFLLRTATDPTAHHRASTIRLAAAVARQEHRGYGTRDTFIRVATPGWTWDCSGYAMNWSIEASRTAITADVDLLLPHLDDPDPQIRASASYALATASGEGSRITTALRTQLVTEQDRAVRAGFVLAVAELAVESTDPAIISWTRALWADPAHPAEVRVSAALAWLCLADSVVPVELRHTLDALVTDGLIDFFDSVPWVSHIDDKGLARTLDQMLNNAKPGVIDPWDDAF
ncbi:hypothetical protein [Streptomyces sp. NPDC058955]|uniref:hypothetical protein n=1 Tax=unclassified Streptomyces TaxID=2593676 RepID=UPI003668CD65